MTFSLIYIDSIRSATSMASHFKKNVQAVYSSPRYGTNMKAMAYEVSHHDAQLFGLSEEVWLESTLNTP